MEALLTPAIMKEVLLQCGLAGVLIMACCWAFNIIMKYIREKDNLHAAEWQTRETKFLNEIGCWRESVATALKNNTSAMEKLNETMRIQDKQADARHHLYEKKLDAILGTSGRA